MRRAFGRSDRLRGASASKRVLRRRGGGATWSRFALRQIISRDQGTGPEPDPSWRCSTHYPPQRHQAEHPERGHRTAEVIRCRSGSALDQSRSVGVGHRAECRRADTRPSRWSGLDAPPQHLANGRARRQARSAPRSGHSRTSLPRSRRPAALARWGRSVLFRPQPALDQWTRCPCQPACSLRRRPQSGDPDWAMRLPRRCCCLRARLRARVHPRIGESRRRVGWWRPRAAEVVQRRGHGVGASAVRPSARPATPRSCGETTARCRRSRCRRWAGLRGRERATGVDERYQVPSPSRRRYRPASCTRPTRDGSQPRPVVTGQRAQSPVWRHRRHLAGESRSPIV